jgi:hypothetical protein
MLLGVLGVGAYVLFVKKSDTDTAGKSIARPKLPTGWIDWKNPQGYYRVYLPADPMPGQGKREPSWNTAAVLPTDAQPLMVIIQVTPVKGMPEQVKEFNRNPPQASVFGPAQRKDVTWAGKPATEFTSQVDSREKLQAGDITSGRVRRIGSQAGPLIRYVAVTRVVEVNETIYAVTLMSVDGRPTEADERAVFDSFEILG